MANLAYFSFFNKTKYSFDDDNLINKTVVNILHRSSFLRELSQNIDAYYDYVMKETDKPEIVADNYYGSPNNVWVILLFNRIMDPYYSFPLNRNELETYIVKKYNYNSINQAYSAIHHYELVTTITEYINTVKNYETTTSVIVNENEIDYSTGELSQRSLPAVDSSIDAGSQSIQINNSTSVAYAYKVKALSVYTHEDVLNENRRKIKLLRKEFLASVESEFKKLMV